MTPSRIESRRTGPGERRQEGASTAMQRIVQATVLAMGVTAGAGGQTLTIINNPALGEFLDITQSGQSLALGDDQEAMLDGSFQGNFVLQPGIVVVGINGGVSFGIKTVTNLAPVNEELPSSEAFIGGQAALVSWDDIDDKDGDVFSEVVADPKRGDRLIVQWNVTNFEGTGATLKFQLQVFDNPDPTGIYAQFLYEIEGPATGAGSSATIGYQDGPAGFGDIQFSFNMADAVTDGTVLSLMIRSPADLNADGVVDVLDLIELLACFGQPAAPPCEAADINQDGMVNVLDLIELLLKYGTTG